MTFCDSCETCAHCLKKGCIPVTPKDSTEEFADLAASHMALPEIDQSLKETHAD